MFWMLEDTRRPGHEQNIRTTAVSGTFNSAGSFVKNLHVI